jgi:hypothetical protein
VNPPVGAIKENNSGISLLKIHEKLAKIVILIELIQ